MTATDINTYCGYLFALFACGFVGGYVLQAFHALVKATFFK